MKISRLYDGEDTELYKTDGYSGSDADIDNTEKFTSDIDLTIQLGAVIDFKFDGTNGTDNITFNLYKRRDSSWDGDEIALSTASDTNDGSEDIYTKTITESLGAGHYRFGMVSAGASTTFEMDAEMRTWRLTEGKT